MKTNRFQNGVRTILSIAGLVGLSLTAQAQAPAITSFSPASGPVGTVVTINGTNFNHDKNGAAWTGTTPPYRVAFTQSGGLAQVTPTFISSTQIRATVPAGTVSAPIRLQQGFTIFSSSATNFTVTTNTATTGKIRVINSTQYNLVDLRMNNTQTMPAGQFVPPGSFAEVTLTPGSVNIVAGIGFTTSGGGRDVWFLIGSSALVQAGQTSTVTLHRITVGQLLTIGSTAANWDGQFFDNNSVPHLARFHFTPNGGWTFFVDGVQQGSGAVSEFSWPNNSSTVQFRINSSIPVVTIGHPFGSFFCQNGPANFRIIEYVRQ